MSTLKNKFLLTLLPSLTLACSVPPQTLFSPIKDLVKRTEHIVLAKVQKDETPLNNFFHIFTFEVDSNLKGELDGEFTLDGYPTKDNENILDENNAVLPGDCNAYGRFKTGETYLVFLGKYSHVKSFQRVKENNDPWVSRIKELISKEHDKTIREEDTDDTFVLSQAYKSKCSACHGLNGLGEKNGKKLLGSKLFGQSADDIFKKLVDFKIGRKENVFMKGILTKLTEEDLQAFADEIGKFYTH